MNTKPTAAQIEQAKSIFGQLGGRATSAKKAAAARRNGKKGGAPRRKKK